MDFKYFANNKNKLESLGQKFRNFNLDTRMEFGIEKCFDVDNEHRKTETTEIIAFCFVFL